MGLALALFSMGGIALEPSPEISGLIQARALVYCPVVIDMTGCDRIVQVLSGDMFPGGVERGYDGSAGTVDLSQVDLAEYAVLVIPALADDDERRPYDLLRSPEVVERLAAGGIGRVAIWSGTPDQGTANAEEKAHLLTNMAGWAGARGVEGGEPGIVVLQDASIETASRYGWLSGFAPLEVQADTRISVHDGAVPLTPAGSELLRVDDAALAYPGMASFGLLVPEDQMGVEVAAVSASEEGEIVFVTYESATLSPPLVLASAEAEASSQSYTWVGGTGAWEEATNWDPVGTPGAGDQAAISTGSVLLQDADVTVDALTLTGGTLTIDHNLVMTGALTLSNGTIVGTGDLTIGGLFTWANGTIGGSGAVEMNGGGHWENTTSATQTRRLSGRTLTISSSVSLSTTTGASYLYLDGDALVHVAATGALNLANNYAFADDRVHIREGTVGTGQGVPAITNDGLITSGGTKSSRIDVAVHNHATGTLDVANSTLHKAVRPLVNRGIIGGRGTLKFATSPGGLFEHYGTVAPALLGETGALSLIGDLPMAESAVLDIELGGTSAVDGQFDRLLVTGDALLSGTLRVTLMDGYVPEHGDSFDVMTYVSRTGDFLQYEGLDLGNEVILEPTFMDDRLRLTVVETLIEPPVAADLTDIITGQGIAIDVDVLSAATLDEADAVTISAVSDPTNGATQIVSVDDVQLVRYTPDAAFAAAETFTYTLSGLTGSDVGDVTVTINSKPTFESIPPTLAYVGEEYSYLASATDPEGDPLGFTADELPAWLSFVEQGDGTALLSGTPSADGVGSHGVTLTVSDVYNVVGQQFSVEVEPEPTPTGYTWTGGAGSDDWHTENNWSPVGIPAELDQATISTGSVRISSGAVTVDELSLSGATLTVERDLTTAGPLTLSSGTINGAGDLTVQGLFTWRSGGTIGGSGTVRIAGGADWTHVTGNWSRRLSGRTFHVDSDLALGVDASSLTYYLDGDALIDIAPTAELSLFNTGSTFNIQRGTVAAGQAEPRIQNRGTITTSGSNTTRVYVPLETQTGASLNVTQSTLDLRESSTLEGLLAVAEGAAVEFRQGSHALGGTVEGSGRLLVTGSSTELALAEDMALVSGELRVESSSTLRTSGNTSLNTVALSSSTITGSGNLTFAGPFTWRSGGTIGGSGTVTIAGGADWTHVTGNWSRRLSGRTFHVDSDLALGVDASSLAFYLDGDALIDIAPTAELSLFNTGSTFSIQRGTVAAGQAEPRIQNRGTITTSGSNTTRVDVPLENQSGGLIDIAAATLHKASYPMVNSGTIGGRGTLQIATSPTGLLRNDGTVAPGLGENTGALSLSGDLPMDESAVLDIELGGTSTVDGQFDRLLISGNALLSGTLRVSLMDGYVPEHGDSFEVMTYASRTGDFLQYEGLDLGNEVILEPAFMDDRLRLTVVEPLIEPPVAADLTDIITGQGVAVDVDVLNAATLAEADAVTISSVSDPANGTTEIVVVDDVQLVRYTPDAAFAAAETFTYTLSGLTGSDTGDITVTINLPPEFTSEPETAATVGRPYSYTLGLSDPETDALTLVLSPADRWLELAQVEGAWVLSGTPAETDAGDLAVSLTTSDGYNSVEQAFTISVSANEPPSFTSADEASAVVNEEFQFTVEAEDLDGDPLTLAVTVGALPAGLTFTDQGDNTASIVGTPTETGTFPLTLQADDGLATAEQSFTLTVQFGFDPPIAADVPDVVTGQGTAVDVDVLSAATLNEADAVTISSVSDPANGTAEIVVVDDVQLIRYTPDAAFAAAETFTYTLSGLTGSDTGDITVTINVPPEFTSEPETAATVGRPYSYTVELSDAETDALTLVLSPADRWLELAQVEGAWVLSGTPAETEAGDLAVSLTTSDGHNSVEQAFTISVSEAPDELSVILHVPDELVDRDELIEIAASFQPAGPGDYQLVWNLADGSEPLETNVSIDESQIEGSAVITHSYTEYDVYNIRVEVSQDGLLLGSAEGFVVVADPDESVSGNGSVYSRPGAYVHDKAAEGEARFGFQSRYRRGSNQPEGRTSFRFRAGRLDFDGHDMEHLVISNGRAQYRGTGSLNGEAGFSFVLVAVDADESNAFEDDRFRIKIWTSELGEDEGVVYDNKLGCADNPDELPDDCTQLTRGRVTIRRMGGGGPSPN